MTTIGALCAAVVMLALWSGSAGAAYTHSFISSFGSFSKVTSIAIDQSTGDVYVFDNGIGGGTISKFDPEGKPVNFSSTGTNEITNVGTDPYNPAESEIAVDSNPLSKAYGDIYAAIVEANEKKLVIFSASGAKVGELTKEVEKEVSTAFRTWLHTGPCGVATDPQGNVYVGLWGGGIEGHVNEYAPSGTHPVNTDYVGSLWGLPSYGTCSIAVDSAGNTFVGVNGTVYSASQFNKTKTAASGSAAFSGSESDTLATDPSTDELYVDTSESGVLQFGPHGEPFGSPKATFAAFGEGAILFGESYGVAVNKSGDVYVSDGSGHISKFGPTVLVPDVTIEPASNVGTTSATVSGTVNPDGVEVTSCAFEYGVGGKYDHSVACPTAPGSGSSPVPETVELTGLASTYGYSVRLSARNAQGQTVAAQSFTTLTPTGPPSVSGVYVYGVTKVAAIFSGSVDPTGLDTVYRFEYGTTMSYGMRVPVPDVDVGSSFSSGGVEAAVTGLSPGTEYHVRLVASNSAGTTYGPDQPFTTLPAAVIVVEHASAIGLEEAKLEARIGPLGDATTYHFEYGSTSAYGTSVPVPDGDAGTGSLSENVSFEGEQVSQHIGGLQPGMTYHYRVVATNALGSVPGQDRTFTTTSPPVVAPPDNCPNAAFRAGGLSEGLPDCRAYEKVSPLDKNGSDIGGRGFYATRASVDGDRASFIASTGFGDTTGSGANGSVTYIASRGSNGWSFNAVTPPSPLTSVQTLENTTVFEGFSSDLQSALVYGFQLVGGASGTGSENFYHEDLANGGLETATLNTSGSPVCLEPKCWDGTLAGYASNDVSVITFQTREKITPEKTTGMTLYAWEHGAVHVAGVLPDGSLPAGGSESAGGAGGYGAYAPVAANDSVSSDGSRILFVSPVEGSGSRQLYMRKKGTSTVWLSRPWISPSVEPEGVKLQAASPDGTKVLFTSRTPLLGSDPNNAEVGLYLYTDTAENAESEAKLTFIARLDVRTSNPSEKEAGVTAMNGDASHIYIANPTPSPGLPEKGEYLWDNGTLHHILNTPIVPEQALSRGLQPGEPQVDEVRVSADGRRLAFLSAALANPAPGQDSGGNQAMYLYDEGTEKVRCVSCPPNGAPMTAPVYTEPEALLPGLVAPQGYPFAPRWFSSDGRFVFFSSKDALVPQDTNGLADVYEYDADTGQIKLLSSGTGENGSWFEEASANGSDAFFLTSQKLTGWDTDRLTDLYDVRIDGGLPEPPPAAVPCDGDACQGIPSAVPSFNTESGFAGLGNQLSGAVKAKAKKKGKSKPRKQRKRKHGKHGRKARRSSRHVSSRVGR
ncbi:MAG TPA: hypothetical protein VGY30_03760 [Solirubrobacteraceae bacterium]|nr:hypothetical protein [Solirubrobacteraceae bacterium]